MMISIFVCADMHACMHACMYACMHARMLIKTDIPVMQRQAGKRLPGFHCAQPCQLRHLRPISVP